MKNCFVSKTNIKLQVQKVKINLKKFAYCLFFTHSTVQYAEMVYGLWKINKFLCFYTVEV